MKLADVIAIWDIIHVYDCGDLGFCELLSAIDTVIGIEEETVTLEIGDVQ